MCFECYGSDSAIKIPKLGHRKKEPLLQEESIPPIKALKKCILLSVLLLTIDMQQGFLE